uniref:PPM-type phosphatase domain-containing protein n=1 Tax=viral metagenome TaxID=1070528 RepID=A0A6C0C9K6_9ZZZZ
MGKIAKRNETVHNKPLEQTHQKKVDNRKYQQLFQKMNISEKRTISYASASQSKCTIDTIHLDRDSPLGEDGHIIKEQGNHLHAAVFDGVGGARNSRQIVEFLKHYVRTNGTIYGKLGEIKITPPLIPPTGASTIACANISSSRLDCMVVGDSVVQVYRNAKLVFSTRPLQHSWNMPAQVKFKGNVFDCSMAPTFQAFLLQLNDVIILSTDGMTDNLFIEEIEDLLSRWKEPTTISQLLVATVKRKINMKSVATPFGKSIEKLLSDSVALQEFKNGLSSKNDNIEEELKKMITQAKDDDCTVIAVRID